MLQEFPRFSRCAVVAAAWGMSVVSARVRKRHGGNGARAAPVPFFGAHTVASGQRSADSDQQRSTADWPLPTADRRLRPADVFLTLERIVRAHLRLCFLRR